MSDNGYDRIRVFDANTLAFEGTFGGYNAALPHDMVLDSAGQLLVADTGNSCIAIFALDGAMRGGFSWPVGVAGHPNGRVYATGTGAHTNIALDNGRNVAKVGY